MTFRNLSWILAAASMCAALGCDDKSPAPPSSSAKAQAVAPTISMPKLPLRRIPPQDRMGRGRRPQNQPGGLLLAAAMKAPDITADQQSKLEALKNQLGEQRRGPSAEAPAEAYREAWLESVKKGKVEEGTFDEFVDAVNEVREAAWAKRAKLINEVHAVLTPAHRKAVADTLRQRLENMDERRARGPKNKRGAGATEDTTGVPGVRLPGAKGPGLLKVDQPSSARGLRLRDNLRGMQDRRARFGFGFRRMATGLELTEEQTKKLDALVAKAEEDRPTDEAREKRRQAARQTMVAMLEAFEKGEFDAAKLAWPRGDEAGPWMKKQADYFSEFLGLLTQEQRTKLATRFDAHGRPFLEPPANAGFDEIATELGRVAPPSPAENPEAAAEEEPAK